MTCGGNTRACGGRRKAHRPKTSMSSILGTSTIQASNRSARDVGDVHCKCWCGRAGAESVSGKATRWRDPGTKFNLVRQVSRRCRGSEMHDGALSSIKAPRSLETSSCLERRVELLAVSMQHGSSARARRSSLTPIVSGVRATRVQHSQLISTVLTLRRRRARRRTANRCPSPARGESPLSPSACT